jgi:hypothetical protein
MSTPAPRLSNRLATLHADFLTEVPGGDPVRVRAWARARQDLRGDLALIARLESLAAHDRRSAPVRRLDA